MTDTPNADAPSDARRDAANYVYWQEHGGEWGEEYDSRKRRFAKYHIQELMLNDYMRQHAPARVLEFGCGVGRHLRHLSQVTGIDINGYDQSPTMVAECRRWAAPDWIKDHVTVGAPTGNLPYGDGEFDVVYTSEVLVHVRPEDIGGILSELLRICRGHVLHLEPGTTTQVCTTAHDGCWNHDLVATYGRIGRACERLAQGYQEHTPHRVVVSAAPRYTWPDALLALYRRLERDLSDGLTEERKNTSDARFQAGHYKREMESAQQAHAAAAAQVVALEQELAAARAAHAATGATLAQREAALADLEERLRRQVRVTKELGDELDRKRCVERDRAARLALERDAFLQRAKELLRS